MEIRLDNEDGKLGLKLNTLVGCWVFFFIGLFSFSSGIGTSSVGFIVIGLIELVISFGLGFKVYQLKKESNKTEKSNEEINSSVKKQPKYLTQLTEEDLYNRETVNVNNVEISKGNLESV